MRVEPSLATEIVEYMMRYCCRSTGPPSQEEMTGFIIVASQAQAHTFAPEQKETLSVIPAHNCLEIVQEEGRSTLTLSLTLSRSRKSPLSMACRKVMKTTRLMGMVTK